MKRVVCLALIFVVAAMSAMAIPAKKQIVVSQPDGTTITLNGYGDEWYHYFTTTDGYTVLQGADCYYYYANQMPNGQLARSTVRANNPLRRSAAERAALNGRQNNLMDNGAILQGERMRVQANQRRNAVAEASRARLQRASGTRAATGSVRTLVLLADYKDVHFTTSSANTAINNLLNQNNYGGTGSAKNYYEDNSQGVFSVSFDVFGPYELPQNRAYYGANDINNFDIRPGQMITDICNLAHAAGVNFTNYATDGQVPNLIVIYAGKGEADGGPAESIWPHEWSLSSAKIEGYGGNGAMTLNGVVIDTYACSSELQGSGALTGIGTICHEYGHALGLPDFYDTDDSKNGFGFGLNIFSLMSSGNYCYNSAIPPALNIAERWIIGWTALPTAITISGDYTLEPVYSNHAGYIIKTKTADDFYFLENRNGDLFKWDKVLKNGDTSTSTTGSGNGLLIYHYDRSKNTVGGGRNAIWCWDNNAINAYAAHECFKLMMAQTTTANGNGCRNIGKVFYPGDGNVTDFVATGWTSGYAGVSLSNIALSGNDITFTATVDEINNNHTITNIVVTPNQWDITVTWDGADEGSWRVQWRTGGGTFAEHTVTHKIANLPNLRIGTTYEIVITDLESSESDNKTATTKTVTNSSALPSLNNIKGGYRTYEAIILSVINMQNKPVKIEWMVNGVAAASTCLFMNAGRHIIEAKITNEDGSVEYLKRVINVTN